MLKRTESIDRELEDLKATIDNHFLFDLDDDKLRAKIREAIQEVRVASSTDPEREESPLQQSVLPRAVNDRSGHGARRWRWVGPFAANVAAVAVVFAGILLYISKEPGLVIWSGKSASPTVTEAAGLFSGGFAPLSAPDALQFQHINSVEVILGNTSGRQTPESVDEVKLTLTASQQQTLYQIMQKSLRKSVPDSVVQSTSLPICILFGVSSGSGQITYEAYYSTSGAMTFGNQVYAPNPALAAFMNQYLIDLLLQKYRSAGKILPTSLEQAALGFVRNLGDASTAYRYCVPDAVFRGNANILQLQNEANSRGYADYQIESITYGPGDADATVVLKHPNRFFSESITLNLVHIGEAWVVIQVSTGSAKTSATVKPAANGKEAQQEVVPGSSYGT